MKRTLHLTLGVALLVAWLPAVGLHAEGEADKPQAAAPTGAPVVGDEAAAEALALFKVNWKASGLKGDDRLSQRDFALEQLAKVQHPDVVEAIGKVTRNPDPDLRLLALIYLAEQTAYPHQAGKYVVQALRSGKRDEVLLLTALQTLGQLRYLGAGEDLVEMLAHRNFAVRKTAIATVGAVGDLRLLDHVLKLLGIKAAGDGGGDEKKEGGGKETTEEGYSWDGVDVTYDTGTAGDGDQKQAEKIGKEQLAKNKAEAGGGRGGGDGNASGAGGSSGGGGGGGRGASSRSSEELVPDVLRTLKKLTGEEFDKPSTIKTWLKANKDLVKEKEAQLDEAEKEQKKAV